jgi:parvulin-like peptidyl-prolyl isomerase
MRRAAAVVAMALGGAVPAAAVDVGAPGYREVERVVAVVNDDVVLLSEVEEQMVPLLGALPASLKGAERQQRVDQARRDVLDGLVADRLLQQQVDALHLDVTTEEIDRAVNELKTQNGLDDATLRQALAQQGMTLGAYRDNLRKQLLKGKIINIKVRSRVSTQERDLDASVSRRLKGRKQDFKVHARHAVFLVGADAAPEETERQRARAQRFRDRVAAGESFDALVRTESDPPTQGGGDLGFFKRGEMTPVFEEAAFGTPPGRVADPVRTPVGWHVLLVVERKNVDERAEEEVRRELREQLMAEELERAFKRYVSELRNRAHVETRL